MDDIKKTLNHLLVNLFNRILVIEEEFLRNNGIDLTVHEIHLLEKVKHSKIKNMSTIAKQLHITQSTMSINSKRLIKKGYLIKTPDPDDKRAFLLNVSDKALPSLKMHEKFHKKMINHVVEDLNLEQNETLLNSLNLLIEFFEKNHKYY